MEENYWIIIITLIISLLFILIYYIKKKETQKEQEVVYQSAEYPTIIRNNVFQNNRISLISQINNVEITNNTIEMFNYNFMFPGPLIEAQKGDTLIISYTNKLDEISDITFHGICQNEDSIQVTPNDSFDYKVTLNTPGLFYYHSSIKGQLSKGLFGAILVHDHLSYNEKVLVFSTIKVSETSLYLTNGVHNGLITCHKGVPLRLRMVNCDSDEIMKISIENHDVLKIGGDQGLNEKTLLIKDGNSLILTPGERLDIIFVPRANKIRILTKETVLVTSNASEGENISLDIPISFQNLKKIHVDSCTPVIPIEYSSNSIYSVNGIATPFSSLTEKDAPIVFENSIYLMEITNPLQEANNFYIENYTFQHIDTIFISTIDSNIVSDRIINKTIENKDTIYIPPRPGDKYSKTVVRLAIEFKSFTGNISATTRCTFQSNLLSRAEAGQKAFLFIVPLSQREKYLSSSSYVNYYSSYFPEFSHSACLTKPFIRPFSSNVNNSSYSNDSSDSSDSSNSYDSKFLSDINSITKNLQHCICENGLIHKKCRYCKNSKKANLRKRLHKKVLLTKTK